MILQCLTLVATCDRTSICSTLEHHLRSVSLGTERRRTVPGAQPGYSTMARRITLANGLPAVSRLGLATRGNTSIEVEDVQYALERGVRYFNWCGKPDGLSRAVSEFRDRRKEIVLATQLKARTADEADREVDWILAETNSDRLEVATFYYVESAEEWGQITCSGGAWEVLARRRRDGQIGLLGLTSHQRALAASWAQERAPDGSPRLDMLMIRYNAAHTGAERDVFPVASRLQIPVVTFTALRWRDLLRATPTDPPGFVPPNAADCYRFCLAHPAVSVVLAAPDGRAQMMEALRLLDDAHGDGEVWMRAMQEHGARVRQHRRDFP